VGPFESKVLLQDIIHADDAIAIEVEVFELILLACREEV
jgi:hypothetical protein